MPWYSVAMICVTCLLVAAIARSGIVEVKRNHDRRELHMARDRPIPVMSQPSPDTLARLARQEARRPRPWDEAEHESDDTIRMPVTQGEHVG